MLAPALLMAATASLLTSANARLARVVDRLRALIVGWEEEAPDRAERDVQIQRHRQRRAAWSLRACQMLYAALGGFVGTSLALAVDALLGFRLGVLPTALAVLGVLFLFARQPLRWAAKSACRSAASTRKWTRSWRAMRSAT